MNKFWKVQKKFVVFSDCVRALHFTEFALKAGVHDLLCFYLGDFSYITVVLIIYKRKEERKTVAVFKTHSASVANLEGAINFPRQGVRVPVNVF
jgi:hypothetical protein